MQIQHFVMLCRHSSCAEARRPPCLLSDASQRSNGARPAARSWRSGRKSRTCRGTIDLHEQLCSLSLMQPLCVFTITLKLANSYQTCKHRDGGSLQAPPLPCHPAYAWRTSAACRPGGHNLPNFVHPASSQHGLIIYIHLGHRAQSYQWHRRQWVLSGYQAVQLRSQRLGDTPCQRTCAPHRTQPFGLGSRKRVASCTLAPDRAWKQHPPADTSEQSCSAGHTTPLVQIEATVQTPG